MVESSESLSSKALGVAPGVSLAINNEEKYSLELPSNRFELELEFVQSLAAPAYLHFLATQGYFNDRDFIDFLRYLRYWKKPEYARFITFPHCLFFLDLLCRDDSDAFRREMSTVAFRNFVHEQQFYTWQYRSRHLYGSGSERQT